MKIHSRNVQPMTTQGTPTIRVSGSGMGGQPSVPLNPSTGKPAMPTITRASGKDGTDSVGPNTKK